MGPHGGWNAIVVEKGTSGEEREVKWIVGGGDVKSTNSGLVFYTYT